MTKGFKRAMVLGTAATALFLAGGCRDQQRGQQGPQYVPSQQDPGTGGAGQSGSQQQPVDVNPQSDQEGFKTVPEEQTAPHGIGQDQGQGGSGTQQPVDVNPQPDQEGFKTAPEEQTAPHGINDERDTEGSREDPRQ
jgi:hypothetical protein